eukprot:4546691-Heterocapsa_arctica.AAC.1
MEPALKPWVPPYPPGVPRDLAHVGDDCRALAKEDIARLLLVLVVGGAQDAHQKVHEHHCADERNTFERQGDVLSASL